VDNINPGQILLLGSGETSPEGGRIFETLAKQTPGRAVFAIMETPAGFELNSQKVAGRVADFLKNRLKNYDPIFHLIPARKRGTELGPDNAEILKPLLSSNIIYMGAGSPTYAVRQLKESRALEMVRALHARGAALVLASAAVIAAGFKALPVYEIYKVGQDPFWNDGLDLLGVYGLPLVFIPHWNNQDGGADLDTSRCFMGQVRFSPMLSDLPAGIRVIGLDELTALWIDFPKRTCMVMGKGSMHLLEGDRQEDFPAGSHFHISRLGGYRAVNGLIPGVSDRVWNEVLASESLKKEAAARSAPGDVLNLAADRQKAREEKNWIKADEIRAEIEKAGWQVNDTPAGPQLISMDGDQPL
jgi:hypothetical protein